MVIQEAVEEWLSCSCMESQGACLRLVLLAEGAACVFVLQPHAQAAACAYCLMVAYAHSHNLQGYSTVMRLSRA